MATVDLGKISFTQKGDYAAGTTYAVKDVVQHTDQNETSSFVKVGSSASGQAPQTNGTVNSSHWAIFAKGTSIASANKGTYAGGDTYSKGDIVQYTDSGTLSTYIYINNTPASGLVPSSSGTIDASHWQFVAKGTAAIALSWQAVKTSDFTAVAGEGYFCNTTSNTITVTLPSSPNLGDNLQIVDYAGTFVSYNVELDPGSEKINGSTDHVFLSTGREGVTVTFTDATQGWIATSGVNEGIVSLAGPPYTVSYLIVGGGGGSGDQEAGNKYATGGGGAGGYRTGTFSASPGVVFTAVVGGGGAVATQGGSSSLDSDTITAIQSAGGGFGGHNGGGDGGSGGGGGNNQGGGSGNTPSTSPSQGNNGGSGTSASNTSGGGGGGASAVGANSSGSNGANGGAGSANSITGSSVTYAGGGGGGSGYSNSSGSGAGSGGSGGGGGGSTSSQGTAGTDGLGGGAGGGRGDEGSSPSGRAGGSGVVIVSIPTANYSGTVTGSPTVSTSGSNKIVKFTGDGTFTG